jgi:phospholipase/carboxylesterase
MTQLSGPMIPPDSGKVKKIVVLLHGLGANGADLIGLAPIVQPLLPDTLFVSPDAPYPCDMAPVGYQWFSLMDRAPHKMLEGVRQARAAIDPFLNRLLAEHALTDADLALVGFSQGTMSALYTAFRRARPCAGIVGFSGALIGASTPDDPVTAKPPVCLIHGEEDPVVPFTAMAHAEAILERVGIPHETHARPQLAHSIDEYGLDICGQFLKRVLYSA